MALETAGEEAAGARKKTNERTARTKTAMRTGSAAMFISCGCVFGGVFRHIIGVVAHCVVDGQASPITTSKVARKWRERETSCRV